MLNDHLMSQRDINDPDITEDISLPPVSKRIQCVDGFSLSVQASMCAYCSPRSNIGPWYEVEVGFPSAEPELIMQHAEEPSIPTETVYPYTPIELVEQLIELHGGIVKGDTA